MGNKVPGDQKKKTSKNDLKTLEEDMKVNFIQESFKNTGVSFTDREITNLKLKINDAENYFGVKFDYFICFNSFLFQERVNQIYDNFNAKIENFKSNSMKILIEFDDESDSNITKKIDFDTLLTVILEKLEIEIFIYFDMTNVDYSYINNFLEQLYDSIEMYKYNRKYDNLYFLFPNTDYLAKVDSNLIYLSYKHYDFENEVQRIFSTDKDKVVKKSHLDKKGENESFNLFIETESNNKKKINYDLNELNINYLSGKIPFTPSSLDKLHSEHIKTDKHISSIELRNKFMECIFTKNNKSNLLSCKYIRNSTEQKKSELDSFVSYLKPTYCKIHTKFTYQIPKNPYSSKNHIYSKSINVQDLNLKNVEKKHFSHKVNNISINLNKTLENSDSTKHSMINEIFQEINIEALNNLKSILHKVHITNIVFDNFDDIEVKAERKYIVYILILILQMILDSPLDETYTSLKIIINNKKTVFENQGLFSNNYTEFLDIEKEINRFLRYSIKNKSRIIFIEILDIIIYTPPETDDKKQEEENPSPINTTTSNKYNINSDRFEYKWKEKKAFNSTFLMALLAKKLQNPSLLEEEVITRMNGFLSVMFMSNSSHKSKLITKDEYQKLLY